VANGFLGVRGVEVLVLYPKGKVSEMQEKQFATLGKNIKALAVAGTFDDCQALVKEAFMDADLREKMQLSSANSINVARWLPQLVYYVAAYAQLPKNQASKPLLFAVPSGNYGNLTAGILAKRLGLPVDKFIAASNQNSIVPDYLRTGLYEPQASIATIANAMDVGDPSNFARLQAFYGGSRQLMAKEIKAYSYGDEAIREAIISLFAEKNYLLDPHGATAYLAQKDYRRDFQEASDRERRERKLPTQKQELRTIFLETAHPAKFLETVQPLLSQPIAIPPRLEAFRGRQVQSEDLPANFAAFKEYLLG
jgi:threonine synthase